MCVCMCVRVCGTCVCVYVCACVCVKADSHEKSMHSQGPAMHERREESITCESWQ